MSPTGQLCGRAGEQRPPSLRGGQPGPVRPGLGDPCSGTQQSTPPASSGKSGPRTLYPSGERQPVSLLWRSCHEDDKGMRSGVRGGWTEPPEARRRDPGETSDSTPQTGASQSRHRHRHRILRRRLSHIPWLHPRPCSSPHRPGQTRAAAALLRLLPGEAGAPASGLPCSLAPLPLPLPLIQKAPRLRRTVSSRETFLVSDRPRSHSHEEGGAGREEGPALWDRGTAGETGWLPGAPRDTPAVGSSPLSRAFLDALPTCSQGMLGTRRLLLSRPEQEF